MLLQRPLVFSNGQFNKGSEGELFPNGVFIAQISISKGDSKRGQTVELMPIFLSTQSFAPLKFSAKEVIGDERTNAFSMRHQTSPLDIDKPRVLGRCDFSQKKKTEHKQTTHLAKISRQSELPNFIHQHFNHLFQQAELIKKSHYLCRMNTMQAKLDAFQRLLTIMDELREQCPWDKKQTMDSLRHLTIEEVYELTDAIMDGDLEEVKKEIGDVMLHMVFYSRIASETGDFDIADSLNSICDKLIDRHPHIYGDVVVSGEEEVKANWEKLKLKEGKKSVLEGVPKGLPSMVKAVRIQDKARGVGFDWDHEDQVWDKVNEELAEFKAESDAQSDKVEDEFGDLLFSLINFARFKGINPDDALEKTNRKFIQRFQYLETESKKDGKVMGEMSLEEMDEYWNRAKRIQH